MMMKSSNVPLKGDLSSTIWIAGPFLSMELAYLGTVCIFHCLFIFCLNKYSSACNFPFMVLSIVQLMLQYCISYSGYCYPC